MEMRGQIRDTLGGTHGFNLFLKRDQKHHGVKRELDRITREEE
jgi:hypothetical protein